VLFRSVFVPCYMYSYSHNDSTAAFVGEQCLEGDFIKYNGNNGYVNASTPCTELMQAFSHYTFVKSRAKHIIVDVQGVLDGGNFFLTDPQVLSRNASGQFGAGDLGFDGIKAFFKHHECGSTCDALRLSEQQKDLEIELQKEHRRCLICLDAPSKTMLQPCGHSAVCKDCALKLMEKGPRPHCPVCKEVFSSYEAGVFSTTYVKPENRSRRTKGTQERSAATSSSGAEGVRTIFVRGRRMEIQSRAA